jgi:hypothetical protein
MDFGKLLGHIVSLAMILGTLGLLHLATVELKKEAAQSQSHGVSLGAFNRRLQRGR